MRSLWFLSALWLLIVASTRADTGPSEVRVAVGGSTTVRYMFDADVAWIGRGNPETFDGTSTAVDARTLDITLKGLQAGTGQLVVGLGGRGVIIKVTVGTPEPPPVPPTPVPIPPLPGPSGTVLPKRVRSDDPAIKSLPDLGAPAQIPPAKVGAVPKVQREPLAYRPTTAPIGAQNAVTSRLQAKAPGSSAVTYRPASMSILVPNATQVGDTGNNCTSGG